MTATEAFQAGKLQHALDAQLQEVRANPADAARRLFLFELAAFAGDLDRARRQIDALSYDDPDLERARENYRKLLDAEGLRRRLFRDGVQPSFLTDPPEHVAYRLDALRLLREGRAAEAAELLDQANDRVPPVRGTLNGKPFDELRDADDVFGSVLEVFAEGKYFWVPLEQVETAAISPPRFPRDLIWVPARLITVAGEEGDVFLPALYPGSHEHADEAVKLGRATDWTADAPVRGSGARVYLVGEGDTSLLEWRNLQVGSDSPAA